MSDADIATYDPRSQQKKPLLPLIPNLVFVPISLIFIFGPTACGIRFPGWLYVIRAFLLVPVGFLGLVSAVVLLFAIAQRIGCLLESKPLGSSDKVMKIELYLKARKIFEARREAQAVLDKRGNAEYWERLSGTKFENEVARLYRAQGFQVSTTPRTGDEGADLLLKKDGELIIVQCKRHRAAVGPAFVRELHGTMIHFGAQKAILASTGGFTTGARRHAQGKPIQLIGLSELLQMHYGNL